MAVLETFNPSYGSGIIVAPGVTTASSLIGVGRKSLCLTNLSAIVCYVRSGPVGTVATTADYPVPAGAQVSITKFQDDNTVAYIAPGGTSSLHIIPGEGW
jgi:hypothetical protein